MKLLHFLTLTMLLALPAFGQNTTFTYQGRLNDGANPASGMYDLRFAIYDASSAGTQQGNTLTNTATAVSNGLFTVTLDFGNQFPGANRWLEIGVRPNGVGGFSTLTPRQPLTATPYAVRAGNAANAASVSGSIAASQLTGTISSNNIGAGSISSVMLATGAVGSNQLASGAVTTGAVADGAVTSNKLALAATWLARTIPNPSAATEDFFGSAVAALGSDRIIIGEPNDDTGANNSGVVHLFHADGTRLITLTNPAPSSQARFGVAAVTLGVDRLIVGADRGGASSGGMAFLLSTNGAVLSTFTNPASSSLDSFGSAVAAVGADRILIGAYGENAGDFGVGIAYLFNTNGTLLTTFNSPFIAISESFGRAVAAVGSNHVLIGAHENDTGVANAGAAHLFTTGAVLVTTFTNPTPELSEHFGWSLTALGADRVVIGARRANAGGLDAGAAYLFRTNGTLLTTFTNPVPASSNYFGHSVAVVGNDRILIGATRDYFGVGSQLAGVAYLFSTNGALLATLRRPAPQARDGFGSAVAALGSNEIIIGALGDNLGATAAGAAYRFRLETYANGLVADAVKPRAITTASLEDGSVTAAKIGGVLYPDQIPDLDASKIISGVLNTNRIPNLAAAKITTGTLADARLSDSVVLEDQANYFLTSQYFAAGFEATPGITFNVDVDTGLWLPTANNLALVTGGAERMRLDGGGNVGIGETAPEGQLHVTGNPATPQIKIETTANNSFVKLRLESFGKPYWDFAVGGSANVMNWFYSGTSQNLMSLATNGTLTTVGPVNPPSDRNVKQDFAAVDAMAVLEKVAALPIQSWAYKNSPETRHIGPVAQDFHAAFQFNGDDDKHISTVDADGVALAAIQGLNAKVESGKQKAEMRMANLEAENSELKQAVNELKELVQKLSRGAR